VIPQRLAFSEGSWTVLAGEQICIFAVAAGLSNRGNRQFCPSFQFIEMHHSFFARDIVARWCVPFPGKEHVGRYIGVIVSRWGRTIARPPIDKRLAVVVAPAAAPPDATAAAASTISLHATPICKAPVALVPPQTVVGLAAAAAARGLPAGSSPLGIRIIFGGGRRRRRRGGMNFPR
jgi:hypothetical protein